MQNVFEMPMRVGSERWRGMPLSEMGGNSDYGDGDESVRMRWVDG